MKKMTFLALAFVTMIACKNNEKTESETVSEEVVVEETVKAPMIETGCYEYNSNGNIIRMEIKEVNEKVTGDLNIAYDEKDANKGKFIGTLDGDKIIGTYTFMSEGTESTREIAFMVKDNQLVEGFGELNADGTKFKDASAIKYDSKMPLSKVDCTK